MSDVVITISVSSLSYRTWLRTSYTGLGLVSDGTPMVKSTELGVDQEDALVDFLEESTREVLKVFLSRQGDAEGVPFEYDGINAIYRFKEGEPVLNQAAAIKSTLEEDVKNAIYTAVTILWYGTKLNAEQLALMQKEHSKFLVNIEGNLYRLHD